MPLVANGSRVRHGVQVSPVDGTLLQRVLQQHRADLERIPLGAGADPEWERKQHARGLTKHYLVQVALEDAGFAAEHDRSWGGWGYAHAWLDFVVRYYRTRPSPSKHGIDDRDAAQLRGVVESALAAWPEHLDVVPHHPVPLQEFGVDIAEGAMSSESRRRALFAELDRALTELTGELRESGVLHIRSLLGEGPKRTVPVQHLRSAAAEIARRLDSVP